MKILRKKNKQELPIENGNHDVVNTLLNNPSYFEVIEVEDYEEITDAEAYEKIVEHLHGIMNESKQQSNDFEKELAAALNDYQSALNLQEELRNKLLNSLKHAKKAKQDKDCKWPYDGLLDSLIDSIQKNSTTKE